MSRPHLSGYQARDIDIVDYEMFELQGTGLQFRGPRFETSTPADYFTCIGAAQTFGCFCDRPYPNLLAERLSLAALNLGYGGAGPEFFLSQPSLLDYINRGRFVVVQVMSGRSQSNSLFESQGLEFLRRRSDGAYIGAAQAYDELMAGSPRIRNLPLGRVAHIAARLGALNAVLSTVRETRERWIESSLTLLSKIRVPTILFWFSKRAPAYRPGLLNSHALFGEFPHLINQRMVDTVKDACDAYAECISSRGSPQPLISRLTGQPTTVDPANDRPDLRTSKAWTHNAYYPSPEMHEDAANALLSVCAKVLEAQPRNR